MSPVPEPPPEGEEAARFDVKVVGYLPPTVEVTDFGWRLEPRYQGAELVGANLVLYCQQWPVSVRLLWDRLELANLATGALHFLESDDASPAERAEQAADHWRETPHRFVGRVDRDCELCHQPDRADIHTAADAN